MITKDKPFFILAFLSLFSVGALFSFGQVLLATKVESGEGSATAALNETITPTPRVIPPGFYQFNNLEITRGPSSSEPPATLEAVQKSESPCVVLEGKTEKPVPCPLAKEKKLRTYIIQVDEKTSLLGIDREPAVLTDFEKGEKINVLGFVSQDFSTIRAVVMRNLEKKDFHQNIYGTIKEVTEDGFVIVTDDGKKITVKNPIVPGAKVSIQGVFEKTNNLLRNVLSMVFSPLTKEPPVITEETPEVKPAETSPQPASSAPSPQPLPSKEPSKLFKNFLKVFGL